MQNAKCICVPSHSYSLIGCPHNHYYKNNVWTCGEDPKKKIYNSLIIFSLINLIQKVHFNFYFLNYFRIVL